MSHTTRPPVSTVNGIMAGHRSEGYSTQGDMDMSLALFGLITTNLIDNDGVRKCNMSGSLQFQ